MIQPLTPQEKAELNAWIAEHVYNLAKSDWDIPCETQQHTISNSRNFCFECRVVPQPEPPNYTDEWSAAGPLLERYEFIFRTIHTPIGTDYEVSRHITMYKDELLAQGTTGPEAIAKAVKQYEEQRRER